MSETSVLAGRTAVVTGAGRGIGRATAARLAQLGARVIAVARDEARLVAACSEAPGTIEPLAADVTVAGWLEALEQTAPAIDIVVHAAMAFPDYARSETFDEQSFSPPWQTGVVAAARLSSHAVVGMRRRRFGRLLFVGSAAGRLGGRGQAAYAAAKAALVGLARSLAVEHGRHGVTANVVAPGLIDTERTREVVPPATAAGVLSQSACGRLGEPEEVAWVLASLACPAAAFVSGAEIPVDGGLGLSPGLLGAVDPVEDD